MDAKCLKCGYKAKEDEIVCVKCGCDALVVGEEGVDYLRTEKGISCVCGQDAWKILMHVNGPKVHTHMYKCKSCANRISLDIKHEGTYED